eukprot:gene2404-4665_t
MHFAQFSLSQFNFDVLNKIFSYLWFKDLCVVASTSTSLKDASLESTAWTLCLQILLARTKHLSSLKNCNSFQFEPSLVESKMIHLLARRVSPWPSDIDRVSLLRPDGPDDIEVIQLPSNGRINFMYTGRSLGGDRAIIADCFFPCSPPKNLLPSGFPPSQYLRSTTSTSNGFLHPEAALQIPHRRLIAPFTKTILKEGLHRITLSCIAYFEVTIHTAILPVGRRIDPVSLSGPLPQQQACVAIGVACALFPLRNRMPGWDVNSFGYHGDDGNFFHGGGSSGIRCGPTFGVGDTVGCGLIYPPLSENSAGTIFFTKNGELVASIQLLGDGILNIPYFPVVGLDTYNPVAINFGHEEFQFDIHAFETAEITEKLGGASWNKYIEFALQQEIYSEQKFHPLYVNVDTSQQCSYLDMNLQWMADDNITSGTMTTSTTTSTTSTSTTTTTTSTTTSTTAAGATAVTALDEQSVFVSDSLFLSSTMREITSFCIREITCATYRAEVEAEDDEDEDEDESDVMEDSDRDPSQQESLDAVAGSMEDSPGGVSMGGSGDCHTAIGVSVPDEEMSGGGGGDEKEAARPDKRSRVDGLGQHDGSEKGNNDDDDGHSATTSLYVEVASVDGGPSNYSYAASETEEEADQGSLEMWGSMKWNAKPFHRGQFPRSRVRGGRGAQVRGRLRYDRMDRDIGGDGDGYDAASELGRGYVTDDIPTDIGDECGGDDDITDATKDKGAASDGNMAAPVVLLGKSRVSSSVSVKRDR